MIYPLTRLSVTTLDSLLSTYQPQLNGNIMSWFHALNYNHSHCS